METKGEEEKDEERWERREREKGGERKA